MTFRWNAEPVLAKIRRGVLRGLFVGGTIIHDTAVETILTGPKTGRIYRRGGRLHQASAPGEAPASDNGRLAGSGQVIIDEASLSVIVKFSTRYAAWLEFGTRKMEPRPFLRPRLINNSERIILAIINELRLELR